MKERPVNSMKISRFALLAAILCAAAAVSFSSVPAPTASIIVTNNSHRDIIHIYLSPPNTDDWGPNQIGDSAVRPGGSATLDNVSCANGGVKVIGEDGDGCFVSTVVTCADNVTWTITDDTARDCGN